jgi:hypothetical protein
MIMSYDPTIGRWISQDPIGFAAGDANLYRYVNCNPESKSDPSGLEPNQAGITDPQHVIDWLKSHTRPYDCGDRMLRLSDAHDSNHNRYFYTEKYGWVDIRHFGAAAYGASIAPGWMVKLVGFVIECQQLAQQLVWHNQSSGFSPEDLPSNSAGVDFMKYLSECYVWDDEHPLDPDVKYLEWWLKSVGALPAQDPRTGWQNLPREDRREKNESRCYCNSNPTSNSPYPPVVAPPVKIPRPPGPEIQMNQK